MPRFLLYLSQILTACLLVALTPAVSAQQRTFINGGFEQNDPQGPGNTTYQIFNDAAVTEWSDDTGFIELWDTGFQGINAYEGDVFAELNANSQGTLFQDVCLVNGETLGWTFAHRARSGGPNINPQTVLLEIADSSGTIIQSLASQSSFIGNPWSVNSSSVTYTGPTGVQRARFRTTNSGSYGNFLDDLQFDISAFAQFSSPSGGDFEASGGNIPSIQIFGRVDSPTSIPVSVIGGTADSADYTQTAASVFVPIGIYSGQTFPIPITITENAISEPNETIEILLGAPSTSEILLARTQCDGAAPITSMTYTILNDDGVLAASKSVALYNAPGSPGYAVPGQDVVYTIKVTNTSTTSTNADGLFLIDVLPDGLRFYNGDIDDGGPETNPVSFTQIGAGLSFNYASDIGYSSSTSPPTSMSACNFMPASGYVDTVNYICFAPQGAFLSGTPDPYFEVSFRMQIE